MRLERQKTRRSDGGGETRPAARERTSAPVAREIVARVEEIAGRVGGSEGIEIVDVALKGSGPGRLLRVVIDKPGGVSHTDCEFISKQIGTILDVEDVMPDGSYTLEVSSPGIERPLKKPADYERFLGKRAKIVLREPVASRRQWEGTLAGFSNGIISLQPASGEPVELALALVERANLKFDW
ncbi:MAG: ribosome maturation factor RimP [Bryobacteraceae bacterium]|nr:ribosome maturation factor RimP [Bryobacteraceae bacterium]